MCFNRTGEMFCYDSDMEWDVGLPWYRPTRMMHVPAGAEFGWRSGWSVWPDYYFDSLPGVAETGRGSPTGMVAYNHVMYPRRYQDALFMGDWAHGRIICLKVKPSKGGYSIEGETFVEGRPLNITDLVVGPDGWLYFCTGGRATDGGIYRVVWQGQIPPSLKEPGKGIDAALKQPQLQSAYARQNCAVIKQQLGDKWDEQLPEIAASQTASVEHRLRRLELLQLLGPFPKADLLCRLTGDTNAEIRAQAAFLLGLHGEQVHAPKLYKLLRDAEPVVQRTACEALVRAELAVPAQRFCRSSRRTPPKSLGRRRACSKRNRSKRGTEPC